MRCVAILLSLLLLAPSLAAAPCAAAGDLADATMNPLHMDGSENGDSGHDCCDDGEEPVPDAQVDELERSRRIFQTMDVFAPMDGSVSRLTKRQVLIERVAFEDAGL